jgi:hypothetical protein
MVLFVIIFALEFLILLAPSIIAVLARISSDIPPPLFQLLQRLIILNHLLFKTHFVFLNQVHINLVQVAPPDLMMKALGD